MSQYSAIATRPERSPHRRVRVAMLTALAIVASLFLSARLVELRTHTRDHSSEDIVNLLGRQRTFGQQIALHAANALHSNDANALRRLDRTAATMSTQARAARGKLERALDLDDPRQRHIAAQLDAADHARRNLLDTARPLKTTPPPHDREHLARSIVEIQRAADEHLDAQESAMHAVTSALAARVTSARALSATLAACSLLATLFVAIAIVEPVVRTLRRKHIALVDHAANLNTLASRLAVATEGAGVGIWDLDLSSGELVWDRVMHSLYDTDPQRDAVGFQLWRSKLHEEDREATADLIQRAIRGDARFDTVFRIRIPSGEVRHIRAVATKITGLNGEPTRMIGVNWDITETAEANRAMREAQRVAGLGDWSYDPRTGKVAWSEQLFKLVHRDPSLGPPSFDQAIDAFHPDDREKLRAAVEDALLTGTLYSVVVRGDPTRTGERYFRAEGRADRDADGHVTRLFGTLLDVTDDVHQQETLAKITRCVPGTVYQFRVAADGTPSFPFVSEGVRDLYGVEPDDIIRNPQRPFNLVHPSDATRLHESIERSRRDLTMWSESFRITRSDGATRFIRGQSNPERQPDGATLWHGHLSDITDQVEHEHALEDAKIEAESANLAKSEFIANMSHEIRTPMTAILGYADILASDDDFQNAPPRTRDAIDTIKRNGEHLLALINDILDLSKIEAGQMRVELIETSPVNIVEDVASCIRPRAVERGIDLRVVYDSPVPTTIQSDPTRLRQILLNLTGNAVKFTREGSVTIRVECDPLHWTMRFSVIDTGVGMDDQQLETIRRFEAFKQADSSTTREFGGSGLGLRIANALAIMLGGGGIEIRSTEGEGSIFALNVGTGDISTAEMVQPGAENSSEEPPPQRETATQADSCEERPLREIAVLIAEDGPDNQRLIRFHLERAGARVTVADNGLEAVETIRNTPLHATPQLILMDVQMPHLDGYGATRQIRKLGYTEPIIALTAHAMAGDRDRCINAGCDDYLTKPIDKDTLIETCKRWAEHTNERTTKSRAA